jgi:hypothetical protein
MTRGKPCKRSHRLAVRLPAEAREILDQLRSHWHHWSNTETVEAAIRFAGSTLLFSERVAPNGTTRAKKKKGGAK